MDHQTLFDREIAELKEIILKMGLLVETLIARSIKSLKERDKDLAKSVIKDDVRVDRLELEVDDRCIELIAIRQPKASDLRTIMTGVRIATDLERIGDLAEDIAERSIELAEQGLIKPLIDIPEMARLAQEALKEALDAFVESDPVKARGIREKEKQVDKLRDRVHDELLDIMTKDSSTVPRAIPLLLVSRHLERIADHATNIAEDVVYMVEAKVVKHGGEN
ncbi:MAG: phosphate signaling complex protein PhoU [Candidatus Margulisiibacteriota bacterium]